MIKLNIFFNLLRSLLLICDKTYLKLSLDIFMSKSVSKHIIILL